MRNEGLKARMIAPFMGLIAGFQKSTSGVLEGTACLPVSEIGGL
jgi:hypothetical protein